MTYSVKASSLVVMLALLDAADVWGQRADSAAAK